MNKAYVSQLQSQLGVEFPPTLVQLWQQSEGNQFRLYMFEFYGIGDEDNYSQLLSMVEQFHDMTGDQDLIPVGQDATGGIFLLDRTDSKTIYFWVAGEKRIYAKDADRFFQGFAGLHNWQLDYWQAKQAVDADYDPMLDASADQLLDVNYERAIAYMNNQIETLEFEQS